MDIFDSHSRAGVFELPEEDYRLYDHPADGNSKTSLLELFFGHDQNASIRWRAYGRSSKGEERNLPPR